MDEDKRKRTLAIVVAILLNIALVICVIYSVLSAFSDAESVSFSQNVENVRTLTNASANKVELEVKHHAQELQTVAGYVNGFNGVGMTLEELSAYLRACYGTQGAYAWQLVDNTLVDESVAFNRAFGALAPCDGTAFVYRVNAYPALARIFSAASERTLGVIQYTSEFTDASPALTKSFAVTTTVRLRAADESTGAQGYQYKTLMLLLESAYINRLIANNNDIDSLSFFAYSNIIVDNDGNYVISNAHFQGTNCLDFIALYNDGFTEADRAALRDGLKGENYSAVLFYQNNRGQDCVYTIVPVQNSDWHILSIVPIASFRSAYDFNANFMTFALLFMALFVVDIAVVLVINRQLRRATKKAKEANESKSLFLSSMSHDIRTPMNAIIGMTLIANKQLAEEPIDREAVRDCMRSIELSGNHLLTLINDVLDISKIESGRIVLHPSDFSIADTVGQMIEMCQSNIKEKSFVLEAHIWNVTHEYVTGDSLRVNQIFINILTNAIKYTEAGGKITVALSEEAVPGQAHMARFVYKVSDSGIGMTPEFVRSIFDRFTRAVDTRINAVEGTGLGMAIVKQLVDLMGGTIQVESELNVGSTFTVTLDLPIVQDKLEDARYTALPILLIDDDPILLQTTKQSLEDIGAAVDTAQGGAQGLQMADARRAAGEGYRIIFVDWKMERMPGGEVIRALRQRLGGAVRIIVMTAYSIAEIEQDARSAGADAFATKPLFKSKLISLITSALSAEDAGGKAETEAFPDMRVVVAEDNDTNWKVLHRILRFYGIEAERAVNGRRALEKIEAAAQPPDMVLMDIQMPEMNGYDATRAIRALADRRKASVPIYAMTADTFADDVRRCEEAGMDGHLSKPIDIKKVLEIIRAVYEKSHGQHNP